VAQLGAPRKGNQDQHWTEGVMARRKDLPRTTGTTCPDCGQGMDDATSRVFWSGTVVHCHGSSTAFRAPGRVLENPHHGHVLYAECWKCRGSLGCDTCNGPLDDVLCTKCVAWGTPEAFAAHGACENSPEMVRRRGGRRAPQYANYPVQFRQAWNAQMERDNEHAPAFAAMYEQYRRALEVNPAGARQMASAHLRKAIGKIGRSVMDDVNDANEDAV